MAAAAALPQAPPRPPLPPSAFESLAGEAWPGGPSTEASLELAPPSRRSSASGEDPAGDQGPPQPLCTQRSAALSRQSSAGGGTGLARRLSLGAAAPPQLWRESTLVSERAASLGYARVADLCGTSYVPMDRLRKPKHLGEGAFAGAGAGGHQPVPSGRWHR